MHICDGILIKAPPPINEEQRQLAEGTFTKKRMYYNMRIKTLKRNTTNLLKTGLQFRQSKRAEVGAALPVLNRSAKLLQHHLFDQGRSGGRHGTPIQFHSWCTGPRLLKNR